MSRTMTLGPLGTSPGVQLFGVPDSTEGCEPFGPLLLRNVLREEQTDYYRRAS